MKTNPNILAAVLALAASVPAAQAGTITYVSATNLGGLSGPDVKLGVTSETPMLTTNWTDTILVRQFHPGSDGIPTGAELLSATINYYAEANLAYGVENRSRTATSKSPTGVTMFVNVGFTSGSISLTITPSANGAPFSMSKYDGTLDFAGASGWNLAHGHSGPSTDFVYAMTDALNQVVPSSDLLNYVGTGNVTFTDSSQSGKTATFSGGLLTQTFTWMAGADMAITYTYKERVIPEPATLGVLGFGLAVLGALRKKHT